MIRLYVFGRRLPGLSRAEHHQRLLELHAPLVRECAGFWEHCRGYIQNHTIDQLDPVSGAVLPGNPQFDNCSQFWFENGEALLAAFNNDDYFRMLRPDEQRHADPEGRIAIWGRKAAEAGDLAALTEASRKIFRLHPAPIAPSDLDRPGTLAANRTRIAGDMAFKEARMAESPTPAMHWIDEVWQASPAELQSAMNLQGTIAWSVTEHVIGGDPQVLEHRP